MNNKRLIIVSILFLGGLFLVNAAAKDKSKVTAVLSTDLGKITIELQPEKAPKTVANFRQKAKTKAFDRTTFHRLVPGFVIQGGDPLSKDNDPGNDGTGGGTISVEARKLSNVRGSISMASASRAVPIDSQSEAQFFINLNDNLGLDQYGFIPFGKVTEGMEVVNKIAQQTRDKNDRPLKNIRINSVVILQ
ncbi:MAG: peptidylprolyl isomerase [Elusimicrobia bacterium]|nr:peptidylprolyl isomerase [Elusimicrobiota bacterium]